MQYRYTAAAMALFAATTIISSPVPLNINMGAYSPALVVGDGAIGFKGTQSVAEIMNTLQGTAANTAAANGNTAAAPATASSSPATAAAPAAAATEPQGMGKKVASRELEERDVEVEERDVEVKKRDITGFMAALNFAAGALKTSPEVQLGTGEGGSGVGILVNPKASNGTAIVG